MNGSKKNWARAILTFRFVAIGHSVFSGRKARGAEPRAGKRCAGSHDAIVWWEQQCSVYQMVWNATSSIISPSADFSGSRPTAVYDSPKKSFSICCERFFTNASCVVVGLPSTANMCGSRVFSHAIHQPRISDASCQHCEDALSPVQAGNPTLTCHFPSIPPVHGSPTAPALPPRSSPALPPKIVLKGIHLLGRRKRITYVAAGRELKKHQLI